MNATFSGYYMYIEASAPRSKGHKAWLRSPVFTPSSGRCLQFWYHMYGFNVGKLNVLKYSNGSRSSPLYSLNGNQGNSWKIAQVTISSTIRHQVGFSKYHFINFLCIQTVVAVPLQFLLRTSTIILCSKLRCIY